MASLPDVLRLRHDKEPELHPEIQEFLKSINVFVIEIKDTIPKLTEAEKKLKIEDFQLFKNFNKENLQNISLMQPLFAETNEDIVTTIGVDDEMLLPKFKLRLALSRLRDKFENNKGYQWGRLFPIYGEFIHTIKNKTPLEILPDLENLLKGVHDVGQQFAGK